MKAQSPMISRERETFDTCEPEPGSYEKSTGLWIRKVSEVSLSRGYMAHKLVYQGCCTKIRQILKGGYHENQ